MDTFRPLPNDTQGTRIRRARVAANVKANWLAGRLGMTKEHYSRIEHDRVPATREVCRKVADLTRLPFEKIYLPYANPDSVEVIPLDDLVKYPALMDKFLTAPTGEQADDLAMDWARRSILVIQGFLRDRIAAKSLASSPASDVPLHTESQGD